MADAKSNPEQHRVETAIRLMAAFADRTGLSSERPSKRYLWTDSFAVCSFLALARITDRASHADLARRLIDHVHQTLGKHRPDDSRTGWISGLSDNDGEAHPTRGGLRIGKPLPERRAGERFDETLEWERDGQYFHYLTKWMHALDQAALVASEPRYNFWARELAETAYRAFQTTHPHTGRARLMWKMSIDLTRPLVATMGQHDPLDGFVTCLDLQKTASKLANSPSHPDLKPELAGFASMIREGELATADPLGIGGLLMDAGRVAMLVGGKALPADGLLRALLEASLLGLRHYAPQGQFRESAERRLAFRELGLSIGLHALDSIARELELQPERFVHRAALRELLLALGSYAALGAAIESFWLAPAHRETSVWAEHRDINEVMLATSLVPEGFLRSAKPEAD